MTMEVHVRRMRDYLGRAMQAAGFDAGELTWAGQGRYFTVEGTGIDVALVRSGGGESWALREVYDIADLQEGGHRPVVETVAAYPVGQESTAARAAAIRAVERRIDLALDEAG